MDDSELEEQWDIDIPFQDANYANADFKRIKNQEGEMHRTDVIGDKASSRVKGRMVEVVHGSAQQDGEEIEATLVVFEWALYAPAGTHRLENVEIHVVFQAEGKRSDMAPGERLSLYDPWPMAFFPNDPQESLVAPVQVQRGSEGERVLTTGYDKYVAVKWGKKKNKALSYQRIDYRSVTGQSYYYQKNRGKPNAVYWAMRENEALQSGVQYRVRTAVLLGRGDDDRGKFKATVFTWSNVWPLEKQVVKPLRAIGLMRVDDPVFFDPLVTPEQKPPPRGPTGLVDIAARPTKHDRNNLEKVDLSVYRLEDPDDAIAAKVAEKAAAAAAAGGESADAKKGAGGEKQS